MSGKLRELKNRIKSVESTKKITYAMEMVSTAKLKRFQQMMLQSRPFLSGLESLLVRLGGEDSGASHPFFETRDEKKIAVLLMTSDSGLCGSYNMDLIQKALKFQAEKSLETTWLGVGKFGIQALKRSRQSFLKEIIGVRPAQLDSVLEDLGKTLADLFLSWRADAVYVVYSHFITAVKYQITVEKILPLARPEGSDSTASDYIFEPTKAAIFDRLVPMYFEAKVRQVFFESLVSEQMARMTAMHSATENAGDLIGQLTLERNKARQASITKELIEIVSGSRALKIK